MSYSRRDIVAIIGLLAAALLPLARFLFVWPTPLIYPVSSLGTDLPREVWPLARYVVNTLYQTGTLPLWRPYLLSGAPLIGHPVAPILYPPNWMALILPLPLALNLVGLFHIWWMGLGMFLVLRSRFGMRALVAWFGAMLLMLSPKWIAHLSGGHWPTLAAISWWPWVWLGFSSLRATGRLRWGVLLGVALAAQALNHGTYLALSLLWVGACTVAGLVLDRGRGATRLILGLGLAGLIMVGLAAGQLWPLYELLPYSNRLALTPTEASFGSLPPVLLLSTLFPPELKFPEFYIFPGVGVLLLAILGWAAGWSRAERTWAAAALVGGVMSLGGYTPIYQVLYRWVPGFSFFRNPTRWWLLTLFALAILACIGLERWLDPVTRQRPRAARVFVGLSAIYLVASGFKIALPQLLPFDVLPTAAAFAVLAVLLLQPPSRLKLVALAAVLLAELWWVSVGLLRPESETALTSASGATAFLQSATARGERSFTPYDGLPMPQLVSFGLSAADGYDSFEIGAYTDLVRQASGCDFEGYAVAAPATQANPDAVLACPVSQARPRLLALLNVRYLLLPASMSAPPGLDLAWADEDWHIFDLGPGLGRAFGVARAQMAPAQECPQTLAAVDPAAVSIVEEPLSLTAGDVPPLVTSDQTGINTESFSVSGETPGLLVRSETWAPGWNVRVDQQPAPLLRVDCALQGVWLPAGQHEVDFAYAPQGWLLGRWISLGAGVAVGGFLMAWLWRDIAVWRSRRAALEAPSGGTSV